MISSPKNRWLKDIRRLRRCKDDGRLLLEGPHLVAEALDAGIELEVTLATRPFLDAALDAARDAAETDADCELARLLARLPRSPLEVEAALLDELADADSPKGLVAIGRRQPCRLADIPLPREVPDGLGAVYVYADGIQDPGNLGALARVAEAAGTVALLAGPGCCRLQHPRALRASAGSLLRLPAVDHAHITDVDAHLGAGSAPLPRWLSLHPRDGTDLYSDRFWADLSGPIVLAVGSEGPGLGDAVAARTDDFLTIPMHGPVESLNATVAAAVALFEIARRGQDQATGSLH